ncbi:MAG: ATP-binding cassette domain-containing protein [Candidatus Humimicrobiaceae bacterium]
MKEIIRAENLTKIYDGTLALDNVSFSTHEKEIIGLVGDNGAGKSTLLNILVGLFPPDEGKLFLYGQEVRFTSPADARNKGIEIVYQFGNMVEGLNVYKNFFMGREIIKNGVLDKAIMRKKSEEALEKIGISKSPDSMVEALSGGQRQAVALGRAFYFGKSVLLLDEPTTGLSLREVDNTLERVKMIRDKANMSIIFVTHNLNHIMPIADRIIVLYHGEKICDKGTENTDIDEITKMITTRIKKEDHVDETKYV